MADVEGRALDGDCRLRQPSEGLTRPHGVQLGPDVRPWCDDQPWTDIANTDLVIIMGGNAAEAHPCGFKWVTEAKRKRGAKLIVVDPRFNRSAAVADYYAPIRPGSDIAFLMGVIRWCLENDKVQWDYVKNYTNASYLVREDFGWQDGLFTGYDEQARNYNQETWEYQFGDDGYVLSDPSLHPRCVLKPCCASSRCLHAGVRREHLRHAEGPFPQDLRNDRRNVRRRR